ncbi:hypothetical protein HU200_034616 [Digitaria exilis]|uniref:Uncharacterized protein n=1 Tax=Digitaria exilis TaxID=1010633 RepID=A0A835BHR7_9POAL|nr:hypothetical protein HU200_034616 [Digitaria exilis]
MAQVTSAAVPTPDAERDNSPLGSNPGSEDLEGVEANVNDLVGDAALKITKVDFTYAQRNRWDVNWPKSWFYVKVGLASSAEKEKETIEAACGLLGIAGVVGDDLGTSGFMKDLAGTSAASGEEFDPTFLELLEHNFGLYSTEPAVEGVNVEEDKKAEAEHESKTAVDRLRFLEKENERLRDVNDKLQKDLTKLEDKWDTTDRKYKALQKDYDENLTVIENLRDAVVRESDAAKEAKTKVSSLELKLKETEDSLASSKTLDAEKIKRIFDSYSSSLKQFGATPYALPMDLNIDNFLSWIEEEFAGLGDVFSIAGDNFALTCTDGLGRFLEKEDKELLLRVSGPGFRFADFGDLSLPCSKEVETMKRRFLRDFWNAYGRDMAKDSSSKEETEDAEAEEGKEEEDEEEEDDALDSPPILLEVFFCEANFQPRPRAILLEVFFCEANFQPRPRAILLEIAIGCLVDLDLFHGLCLVRLFLVWMRTYSLYNFVSTMVQMLISSFRLIFLSTTPRDRLALLSTMPKQQMACARLRLPLQWQ